MQTLANAENTEDAKAYFGSWDVPEGTDEAGVDQGGIQAEYQRGGGSEVESERCQVSTSVALKLVVSIGCI